MSVSSEHQLDTNGLLCPEPVMMLHKAVKSLGAGETLHMIASDPSTLRDVPKFCLFLNHELIKSEEIDGHYHFWIKKPE